MKVKDIAGTFLGRRQDPYPATIFEVQDHDGKKMIMCITNLMDEKYLSTFSKKHPDFRNYEVLKERLSMSEIEERMGK